MVVVGGGIGGGGCVDGGYGGRILYPHRRYGSEEGPTL